MGVLDKLKELFYSLTHVHHVYQGEVEREKEILRVLNNGTKDG